MAVDGVLAENEALRDLVVRETLGNQTEHLQLTPGQAAERSIHRLCRERRTGRAELPEHRRGASALPVRSHLLEVCKRGLDFAPGAIAPPQGA